MFRRSRLSIRPNVGTAGRTSGSPQEPSSSKDQDNVITRVETPVSVTDNKSAEPTTEQTPSNDQYGEAASSSAIQRRKRFSVRPKVVPGRPPSAPTRTPKSPIKPVLPAVKSPAPGIDKAETIIEANCTPPHQELLNPRECQPSDESRLSKIDTFLPSEGSSKCIDQPGKVQSSSCSQAKEISPKAPLSPSIPDREAIDISEKAKTLMSKTELTTSSQHFSLTQLLNDKSDLLRLEKARKLRQLLKKEMLKEKSKKYMARVKEYTLDPSKMTMRDLIHYLPTSNPMSSSLEEPTMEHETAFLQSPGREISPERAPDKEVQPKVLSPSHGEAMATTSAEGESEHEEVETEDPAEDEDALMVPQVKVAEDGSLIIDEESLTVEVQRMKGPNLIQDRDPIFERGSTTTYSSFRKGTHTKPWSTEETDMFFLAISMVGTDFAMISQLFPHRARSEIKNKFKKEERYNAWRIDKAFRERRKLDLEYFRKLLEKILEFQQNKKKLKSMSEKPKTRKRKATGKKAMPELSDVEEENEDIASTEEQEGEKENLCNKKTSSSKSTCKRKPKDDLSPESALEKKKKKREKKKMSHDASAPADLEEVVVSEDHLSLDQSKKTEAQAAKTAETKSVPLPLGCKGQKAKKAKAVISDTGEATSEETERQITKGSFSSQQSAKKMSDNDTSDHETPVQSARPSRYGRISKPVQPLNYPAKEDTSSSASDTVGSPAHQSTASYVKNKTHGKRGKLTLQKTAKESRKPELITLRASQSEGSDDDEEETDALHYDDENSTSAFVPASLCSPKPVVPEVEETMEELDMLAHMPDVLGMSKNALCPDASCEQVHNDRGTVEPCEHQLDLLVDVIDFLSEDNEASEDESYNEAAQTLLTIGNLTNLAQPTESGPSLSDHIPKCESSHCSDVDNFPKSSFEQEECTALVPEPPKTQNTSTINPVEELPTSVTSDTPVSKPSGILSNTEETSLCIGDSAPRAKNALSSRKGRLSKIKPMPNLSAAIRTTKLLTSLETQQVELEMPTISQHQSLEHLEESTLAVSEPSKTDSRPSDDTTVVIPASHVSAQVDYGPCCKQDTVDSELQTTPVPKSNPPPPVEQIPFKITPNIGCALRTRKQTVEAAEQKTQARSEIISTSQLGSVKHKEESNQAISESEESDCTQEAVTTSQPETLCANNSSAPRRGRLSKIKPKPNIGCALRTTKFSSQQGHAIEEKISHESKKALTSLLGSTECQVESTQSISEQSSCQSEVTDSTTEEMPASPAFNTQVIKDCNESSTTQEATATSQLESPCHKNSLTSRKGRFPKIKPKPNIKSASRTTKQLQLVDATDEKHQTVGETATPSQPHSVELSLPEAEVRPSGDFDQGSLTFNIKENEADQSNTFACSHSKISGQLGQGEEPSTLEEHLGQFTEMSCTPSEQCPEELLELSTPFKMTTIIESDIVESHQSDHSSAEEKTENVRSDQLSDPSSESLKHSTPQRKRWIPKVKPKPNLVSSPRTAKSKLESKENSQAIDLPVKSTLLNAASEQPMLKDSSTAKLPAHFQSVNVESNSASSVQTLGMLDKTKPATSSDNTNITTQHYEVAENQTNKDHCSLMKCVLSAPSDSGKTVHQLPDLTFKKTGGLNVETSEISSDHVRPSEGAAEPLTELQHSDAGAPLGLGQMHDSSVQNSFEFKSLLFPNVPPDQVPSDPDEPFFILSLTEIPVCPSGQEVDHRLESYHALPDTEAQPSNPVEPAVPLAVGIDDSLSNIHIPTPEKAALKSGLICVEEYLPSAPSVDISLLEEPQESPSVRRLNLPEAESNIDYPDAPSADKQPSARGDVQQSSRRQNLMRKSAAKNTNKHENTTQDPPEAVIQIQSSEVVESQTQKDSDGTSVIGKMKTAETKGNKSQTKKPEPLNEALCERTETLSSQAPTANALTCSVSSKDNQFASSSTQLLDLCQSDSTNVLDEEPTTVSEYFFGDVFTEVESDCSVTGNMTSDPACHDKTQSQSAAIKANLRQHSISSCEQKTQMTAQQQTEIADGANLSNLSGYSSSETAAHSSQQDKSSDRGKGHVNRKSKTSGEASAKNSRPQRSAAAKFPKALSQDNLKESVAPSSTGPSPTHETNQLSGLQSTSEILGLHQRCSTGSSFLEEVPTNVSQYFPSDVFTEVKNNDISVTGKSNSNPSCFGTAPSQKAGAIKNERQISKRKASNNPPSGQDSLLTEGQPSNATLLTSLQNNLSSIDVTTADSSHKGAKKTRGHATNRNDSNSLCVTLKSQRKSTEALKPPKADLQDCLKETLSTSSAVQPQNQQESLSGSSEIPVHKNDSDVEVDSGSSSLAETIYKDKGKAQMQTSESSGSTRKKRKTNASRDPALIQNQAHEVASEVHKTSVDPSQLDIEKTRGKGSFKRKNEASDKATVKKTRLQRPDKAASKSPVRISENLSASSSIAQLELQATNQSDLKESSLFDDEPTNVSQYFLSDIFTDVDEEFKS